MDIDRRKLLSGSASLALTELVGPAFTSTGWAKTNAVGHPLTRSLLERARRAYGPADPVAIERVILKVASLKACTSPPVIKWLADPFSAFGYLSRYGLDALLHMGSASLWRRAGPLPPFDDRSSDLSRVLGGVIADIVRPDYHDQALMAPKLLAKRQAMAGNASAAARFQVIAVAAQIGWLETCLPVDAAQAIANVELFLSAGFTERDESVQHQLRVFEAYELGLVATWETPAAIVCVPRPITV